MEENRSGRADTARKEIEGFMAFAALPPVLQDQLEAGVLPVVKVGRDYLTNERELDRWFEANKGKEIFY